MLKFEIYCAMCGREKFYEPVCNEVIADTKLSDVVEKFGWLWQQNGENFDIYCSRKCAQ